MLVNINYRCTLNRETVQNMRFPTGKPSQILDRLSKCTMVIFRSGKCRIMGCRKPLNIEDIPYEINNLKIQSITVTANLNMKINLLHLKIKLGPLCVYEPELFTALRYTKYSPKCVNVFSSGKVVILGLQSLLYENTVAIILNDIKNVLKFEI